MSSENGLSENGHQNSSILTSPSPAISVRGLSKRYSIARNRVKHSTLAESLLHRAKNPLARAERDEFWALRGLNFDVSAGEVVGIIGRNGAGKSTLLKVMSQITEPTEGEIALYGRIGSLLEVGTGFHPELTGRENIFLNGAILGMTKREIAAQFDAIVEFSGVEKFLETPVKRFSSGMYVRLAFAVAAHLSTEILIVDEVLAVGDAEFQRKCLGKMRDVAGSGRTVLFVSHHMQSVQTLCSRAIFLEKGQITYDGEVVGAIERYMASFNTGGASLSTASHRRGSGELRLTAIGWDKENYTCGETKTLRFTIERKAPSAARVFVSATITNETGVNVVKIDSRMANRWFEVDERIEGFFSFTHPWLRPGHYTISFYICSAGVIDHVEGACSFDVLPLWPYDAPANPETMGNALVLADFACGVGDETPVFSSQTPTPDFGVIG
jgi:lipopolysaccharide transport system ATP-binding protein